PDAWRNSLDHYQEFVIIVALDLKIEGLFFVVMITGWITCMPLLLWPMTDSMQNVTKLLV
ncbi:hypothetical protein PY97_13885, partial [Lacticaseibacillus rhamnosus]